jgi:hypothetical protein
MGKVTRAWQSTSLGWRAGGLRSDQIHVVFDGPRPSERLASGWEGDAVGGFDGVAQRGLDPPFTPADRRSYLTRGEPGLAAGPHLLPGDQCGPVGG